MSNYADSGEHFHVVQVLSQSDTTVVSLCKDEDGQQFVLKRYERPHASEAESSAGQQLTNTQFLTELSALTLISTPHVARITGWGWREPRRAPFIVFDHVRGIDPIVAASTLPNDRLLVLAVQLARTIELCHRRGIIHGDISPSNILIRQRPEPGDFDAVLLDFASARIDHLHLEPSSFCVTPEYAAPELPATGKSTPVSDIYSLGMVIRTLFNIRRAEDSRTPPSTNPSLLRDIASLVTRLVATVPEMRLSSAGEVASALEDIAHKYAISVTPFDCEMYARSASPVGIRTLLDDIDRVLAHAATTRGTTHHIHIHGGPGSGKTSLAREVSLLSSKHHFLVSHFSDDRWSFDSLSIALSDPALPLLVIRDSISERFPNSENSARACVILTLGDTPSHAPRSDVDSCDACPYSHVAYQLRPLGNADLADSLRTTLGLSALPPAIQKMSYEWSGGLPVLAWECMRHWIDSGQVTLSYDSLVQSKSLHLTMPASSRGYVSRLIACIDADQRELLGLLVLCHGPVTIDVLARAISFDTPRVEPHLLYLHAVGLIACDMRPGLYRYYVPSLALATSLLATIERSVCVRRHRDIGEALLSCSSMPEHLDAAAHQFRHAGELSRASQLLLQAARAYLEHQHVGEATIALRSALSLDALTLAEQHEANELLVSALLSQGLYQEALVLNSSISEAPSLPEHMVIRAQLRQAEICYAVGRYSDSARAARAARHLSRKHGSTEEWITSNILLGESLSWCEQRDEGRILLHKAGSAARRLKNTRLAAVALRDIASSFWKEGMRNRAYWYEKRRLALSLKAGRSPAVSSALQNLGILSMDAGRYGRARQYYQQSFLAARPRRTPSVQGPALINLAETYRSQGRFPVAAKTIRRGIATLAVTGEAQRIGVANSNLAQLFAATGFLGACRALLAHAIRQPESLTSPTLRCSYLLAWSDYLRSVGRPAQGARTASLMIRVAHSHGLDSALLEGKVSLAMALLDQDANSNSSHVLSEALRSHGKTGSYDMLLLAHILTVSVPRAADSRSTSDVPDIGILIRRARTKGMLRHEARALMTRGSARLASGLLTDAYRDFLRALEISRISASRLLAWETQYWLGRVSERALREERAIGWYRRASALVHEIARDLTHASHRTSFTTQPRVADLHLRLAQLDTQVSDSHRTTVASLHRKDTISRRMLSTLSTIGQELSSILQLDSLLERLLTLSIELVHAHRGVIYLRDESTGTLVAHCARMADGKAIHDTDHFSDSVINKMAHGTTLLVLDVDHDSELSAIRSPTARRVKSVLCVPMKVRDRVAGAIYLDTHDPGQAFGEKERAFVESFASQAAVAIENARLFGQVKAENLRLQQEVEGRFRDLIGTSSAIRRVQKIMAGVLSNHSTILLTGESGTGKGLVARSIHANSVRHSGPFIAVDCGALPDNLLEAELFGHARGAFTGADRDRIGLIEEARGGTLFLDEIGNTSLALQARLLRVLQEKEVRRVGENTSRPVSARFIAATNADLRSMMSQGRFRQDLFYRLNVVLIEVPPLRNRIEDLAPLVDHFLQRHLSSDGVVKRLGPGVMRAFGQYSWPGNVRELEHVLERLVLLSAGEIITVDDLPDEMRPASSDALRNGSHFEGANNPRRHARQPESPKTGEQLLIEDALRRYAGDKAKAARFIGWNRQKLYRRMRLFAIPTEYGRKAA